MNGVDALKVIQDSILLRSLTDVEEAILLGTWSGQRYEEIADRIGYDSGYIKEMGSRLWSLISRKIERKVTKKTLRIVIEKWVLTTPIYSDSLSQAISSPNANADNTLHLSGIRFPGGAIASKSKIYIHRSSVEDDVLAELRKPGAFVHLNSPIRFGKTSLLYSIADALSTANFSPVFIDCAQFEQQLSEELDTFLKCFLLNVFRQLGLKIQLDTHWLAGAGAKNNATEIFEKLVLAESTQPVLLILDNLNHLSKVPNLEQEFFQMLRAWYERAAIYHAWNNLRLLAARSPKSSNGSNVSQSSFNVGLPVHLPPLTLEEAQELAQRYDLFTMGLEIHELELLHQLVDGHPYLLQIAFYELRRHSLSPANLVEQVVTADSIYASYLLQFWQEVNRRPELRSGVVQILESPVPVALSLPIAQGLEGIGLVKFIQNKVTMRCELYRQYFVNCLFAGQG